jgi:hypothetical protein
MPATDIIRRYDLSPALAVIVDSSACVLITTGGFDTATISNVNELRDTLMTAKRFRDAVFPPFPRDPSLPVHPVTDRAGAFEALDAIMQRADAVQVTAMLDDWKASSEPIALDSYAPGWAAWREQ